MESLVRDWLGSMLSATLLSFGVMLTQVPALNAAGREAIKPIEKRSLRAHFRPYQTEFVIGEPVFVEAWLENLGNEVEYWAFSETDYDIINADGTKLKPGWTQVVDYAPSHFVEGVGDGEYSAILRHQKSDEWEVCVTGLCGIGCHGKYYLPVGDYRMTARWLKSDTVLIRVAAPSSSEDSGAVSFLIALLSDTKKCLDIHELAATHAAIVGRFPNSRLIPRSLSELMSVRFLENSKEGDSLVQEYAALLVSKYPTHPYAGLAVFKLDPASVKADKVPAMRIALQQMLTRKWREDYRERIEECLKALKGVEGGANE